MGRTFQTALVLEEIADFIASAPRREALLKFQLSAEAQGRASDLLRKLKAGALSSDENREIEQFEQVELLMRLVKAKLRDPSQT